MLEREEHAHNIGIIGGTFDPVHYGHLEIAREMRTRFALDKVIFMPAPSPPHKDAREISTFEHRYAMVACAIRTENHFSVSDLEAKRSGRSYTVDTLQRLRAIYPEAGFYFLMGMDSFADLTSWKEYPRLFELSNIVVAQRPGMPECTRLQELPVALRHLFCYDAERNGFVYTGSNEQPPVNSALTRHGKCGRLYFLHETRADISSTEIRNRVRKQRSIADMVPEAVRKYIAQHKLYQT
ncbi:MAG: nicotinate-nucleotide adenylyltransferase [Desulfuromonadaceae bacterium]